MVLEYRSGEVHLIVSNYIVTFVCITALFTTKLTQPYHIQTDETLYIHTLSLESMSTDLTLYPYMGSYQNIQNQFRKYRFFYGLGQMGHGMFHYLRNRH